MVVEIDGSILEGGGQILRLAVGFSVLTKRPICVKNIRAGRKKPGLASQHARGIELVREICQGRVTGGNIGSTEIEFHPGQLKGGVYTGDAITAGSTALLLQIALPLTYFCDSPVILNLKGGTNAEMAPQIDFITEIFRPNLEKFGATFDFDLTRRGYFPKGGGSCRISTNPLREIKATEIVDFGEVRKLFGWSFVAGTLPIKLADEMANGAKATLRRVQHNKPLNLEAYKEARDVAPDNCTGIIIGCETTTDCILGGSALGSRKETPYETGQKAGKEIVDSIEARACVDQYVQDQLIIFMTLANGRSRIRTVSPITLHTKTAIYIAELLTNVKFNVIDDGPTCILEVDGIGLTNSFQTN